MCRRRWRGCTTRSSDRAMTARLISFVSVGRSCPRCPSCSLWSFVPFVPFVSFVTVTFVSFVTVLFVSFVTVLFVSFVSFVVLCDHPLSQLWFE